MYSTVWFKKLCKEVVSLEYEEHIGLSLEVDNNQLRGSLKLILLQHMRRCYRTQHWPFYGHLTFEANRKSEKAQYVGISWADWKKKKSHFEMSYSLILCNNNEPFLNWIVTCNENWILSIVGLGRRSKSLPKVKLTPKKLSWSLCGGLLFIWSTTAFWILEKPLHLRSMLSKWMRCTKNFNTCSHYWQREMAKFFFMTMSNFTSHN